MKNSSVMADPNLLTVSEAISSHPSNKFLRHKMPFLANQGH